MKLTTEQIQAVEKQTGIEPIPEDNPAMETLRQHFGDHTYYADANGLSILEPLADDADRRHAAVVQLAAWSEDRTALVAHEPMMRETVIDLEAPQEEP